MWSDDDEYFTYSPHYYGSDDDIIDSDDDLNFSFDDDDYTYCHSVGSDEERVLYPSLLLSKSGHWEVKKHENTASSVAVSSPVYQVQSLVDSCSRFIAVSFPFAYLEHRCPPIPDELQMKVIKFSFPEDKEMIRKYAEFSRSNVDFSYASTLHKNGSVKDLNQIGFRLSAKVNDRRNPGRRGSNEGYYVTIHFDRGKITSAHCSCDLTSNWCEHAIATCLARINDSEKMMVHLPVSDSLNLLNREQLLKFTQYLLCEHQNEQVVDSAQQLLDRLLSRQQKGKEEDINSIAGAPDPTAGPGLDEESHWFVCKSGFKSRCESLVYESWEDLGFVMYRHTNNDRGSSVHEAWKRNMFRSTLIRDEMDQELDHGFSSERQRHSVLQVLEMTEDLLQDDYMSAFAALSVCTEQLIERLNKLCCKKSSRDLFSPSRNQQHDVVKFGGSLAGGFTPRISSCRTLIDELSRLWRLTVINPRVPAKQRPAITSRLRSFTEEAAKAFNSSTLLLEPWLGLEVALRLSRINWATLQFQRVLRGEWVHFPVVSSRMAIHLDYQWNCVDVAHEAGMEVDDPKDTSSGMNPRVTELAVFYNPHCISVDPCCNIDIHSLCCKIETLRANTNHKPAIRLAVAVSCGLVSYYKNLLCGNRDVETIPVSAKCFLGRKRGNTSVPQGFTEAAMEVDEGHKEANNSHVWPEDTLLSITTLAFLFDQLSLESDLVESCLVEMKTKLGLASLPEQQIGLDCLCSAQSLRFQLGIHGLFMHRLPAPSQHGEVEQFETECWLTYRLIGCSPGQNDLMLLTQLGRHVISERTLPGVPPPYSLARVIVYHLFKCASAGLCKSLTKDQTLGLSVAFYVLASDNTIVKEGVNMAWLMFQYANLRLRAKLANVVLHCVADSEEFLEKAMSCILKPNGMVGVPSADELSMRTCGRELFDAKGRVLYCLARSLGGKRMDLADTTRMDLKRKLAQRSRNVRWSTSKECDVVEAETPRKIMKSGVEKALNLCAVRIGAHSVWLQSGVNRRYSQGETVRWLIEFAVNSGIDCVICLTKFEGGIHALLKQTEVFDLCDKVLKKEEKQSQSIVQEVLFSQLQKNSQSESSEEMMAVISFCRENRCASKLDLLPWICQELQSFKDKGSFLPFEVLMHASQAMFLHYREILNSAENRKRQWAQDGSLCLERLFNQGAPLGDDSDEEDEGRLSATQNPYRLPEAHPFLETAFDLGMNGLEKLRNRSDDLDRDGLPYYRCPVREHLEKFCKLVCYLGEKKWLITTAPKRPSRIHLSRRDDQSITAAKPGCSKWDDDYLQCVSREPRDSCYLHKFICCLINCVDNPLWLFSVLQELGDHLHIKGERQRAVPRQELQNLQMKEACRSYMSIKLLLQKVLDAFSKLLLGPKMAELVDDITTRQSERRLETSEVLYELSHSVLFNTRLREVLKVAKRAFSLSDSSASFMSLVREMTSRHSVMESFLDLVMQDKECETEDRDIIMYPHGNLRLTDFVAHRLFPGLFAGSPNNDFFYG